MGKHTCPQRVEVEGNNGGSYIRLEATEKEGVCFLEVGETCVRTISDKFSVVQLAAILTWADAYGFQRILTEYASGSLSDWQEGN
ncbi:MAG: hypothetical protein Q7T61_01145 [Caulobacter sp.]|nr:hypothetical protein [Caulobacter sp.]